MSSGGPVSPPSTRFRRHPFSVPRYPRQASACGSFVSVSNSDVPQDFPGSGPKVFFFPQWCCDGLERRSCHTVRRHRAGDAVVVLHDALDPGRVAEVLDCRLVLPLALAFEPDRRLPRRGREEPLLLALLLRRVRLRLHVHGRLPTPRDGRAPHAPTPHRTRPQRRHSCGPPLVVRRLQRPLHGAGFDHGRAVRRGLPRDGASAPQRPGESGRARDVVRAAAARARLPALRPSLRRAQRRLGLRRARRLSQVHLNLRPDSGNPARLRHGDGSDGGRAPRGRGGEP